MQKEERTPAPKTEWHKGVRVKLCGAKCLLGTGETLDHEPLTLRAPWCLLYLDQSDPYILGTSHSKTIIIFYIVVWVFFWKATCPKNPSLSVNEKSHLSLWLLLFKLEGAWILEKRLFFSCYYYSGLLALLYSIHFLNFIYFGSHFKLTDIWLISRWPYSVTQGGLKFMTVLFPQLPWCWDYRSITVANACSPRTPAH